MNPRERMLAAFDGKPVDVLPTAPFFCGAEYVWKLVGKPIWEVQYGDADTLLAVRRHVRQAGPWSLVMGAGSPICDEVLLLR